MTVKGNSQAQFTASANIGVVAVTAANTSSEGGGTVGTSIFLAFTPGANDSYVDYMSWMPTATTPTTTTATVARVFLSTVNTGTTTSSNTFLIAEAVLPSVAADNASTQNQAIIVTLGFRIGGSNNAVPMYLLVTNHAAPAASSQWVAVTFGNDY